MHSNKVVAIWCLARFYTFASLCLSSCYCAHGKSYFQASFDPETRTRTHHVYVCVCDRMRYVIVVRTYEFYSIPVPKYSERGETHLSVRSVCATLLLMLDFTFVRCDSGTMRDSRSSSVQNTTCAESRCIY